MSSFFVYRGAFRPRFGLGLVAGALLCWGLAAFLLAYPIVAALIVSGLLILAGLTLFGLGVRVWRAEAALHGRAGTPPQEGPQGLKNVDVTVREDDGHRPSA